MEALQAQIDAQQKQIELLTSLVCGGNNPCACRVCWEDNYKFGHVRESGLMKEEVSRSGMAWDKELHKRKEKILK